MLVALAAGVLGGCGLQSAPAFRGASILVSESFGAHTIVRSTEAKVPSGETVLSYLRRASSVTTAPGANSSSRTVVSIDGHRATSGLRWTAYENGIALPKNAAEVSVHAGDHLWWDLHSTSATLQAPAVVGSFPEPFTTGVGGQKLPTLLQCATNVTAACNTVAHVLAHDGVKVAYQGLGTGSGSDSLAILVGTFSTIRGAIAALLVAHGPAQSGVYAQFLGAGGRVLELDNSAGQVTGQIVGTAGLVAATDEPKLNEPAWLVTGTNVRGVEEAADALNPATLHDHYAVAVSGRRDIPVPTSFAGS